MAQETPTLGAAFEGAKWQGAPRYRWMGCLGHGGMGIVHEVFDRERGQSVALKTLRHFGAAGLYEFKQEFRRLADVQHPNLVRLYELVSLEGGEIFFTMELVRGTEFTHYVRRDATVSGINSIVTGTEEPIELDANAKYVDLHEQRMAHENAAGEAPSTRQTTQADEGRLRSALRQLVAGVSALHRAGKVHRDIKPANALVTDEGRVVLLDFGVAADVSGRGADSFAPSSAIVGTAKYMAPEQSEECATTPASDWYSVGVMLYEALVGAPPFVGTAIEVLAMKKVMEAPRPSARVDGVPADLDALCDALLNVNPEERPHGDEILQRLGVRRSRSSAPPARPHAQGAEPVAELVGRDGPLQALGEALEATSPGRTLAVFVTGPSGIGKTRLVHHFLDDLVARRRALVLRGRAYEREAVPYKAFDTVMDSLSRHLIALLDTRPDFSLPGDCWLLGRLFPVLQRIPALAKISDRPVGDPQSVRRRAFSALRHLVTSLAAELPVVIFVDDVHWGDTDSATLLLELVRPPSAGRLLVVMTYQEAKETTPFLTEIRDRWPVETDRRQIRVEPLAVEDAQRLAFPLIGNDAAARALAEVVARASQGQPFLVEELARAHRGQAPNQALPALSVDRMVADRLRRLPDSARRLAEVVAVGGRPLPILVTLQAAEIDPDGADELVAMVSSRRLVRTGLHNGRDVLEPTYDWMRECVVAQLPEDTLRRHHASLARALELQDVSDRDGEAIAGHWLGAGERERAATMAVEAAEQAFAKFAFDQSARLFRLALGNNVSSFSLDVHGIRLRLAQALQMGGRSTESAREYLQAAGSAQPSQTLSLRRIAAEQLLAAGRIKEAEPILHEVLASCGMRAPRSPLTALFWLVVYSLWLALRGYKFEEREAAEVSAEDRMRVEALYTVGFGFGFVNSILSHCMQRRQLIEALRVGDRSQVLIALAGEISHLGQGRPHESARERALVRTARDLATRTGAEAFESYLDVSVGLRRFFRGQWREARELLEPAEASVRHAGNRVVAVNARIFADYTYYYSGEFAEYRSLGARLLAEAEDRGDLYTSVTMRVTAAARGCLASGETDRGRKIAREALEQWPQKGFSVQHWQAMTNAGDLDVYDGDGGRAYDLFRQAMPMLKKSMMLGNWYVRVITWQAWGRLAIASIASRPETRDARVAEARRLAGWLSRQPNAWAVGLGSFVKASAEMAAGDRAAAVTELRRTVALADVADSAANGVVARYRLGQILDNDEGRALVHQATQALQAEWGVKDVARYVTAVMPG